MRVIALRHAGETGGLHFNPTADARLEAADELIVLGDEEQIPKLRSYVA